MDILLLILSVLGLLCGIVFSFAMYHVMLWALTMASGWRVKHELRPIPERVLVPVSVCSALSFLL